MRDPSNAVQDMTDPPPSARPAAAQLPPQAGRTGAQGRRPMAADLTHLADPSTTWPSEADPVLAPVHGMSLEMYGHIARETQERDITDQPGMVALAGELHGLRPDDARAAFATWIERMGRSMVVGQQFRSYLGY